MDIQRAPDIDRIVRRVLSRIPMEHIDQHRIVCVRSYGAKSSARARIWSFPRVWQLALGKPAHYVIEALSRNFDRLSHEDKVRVIIHELLHIPKTFSGALLPHRGRHRRIDRIAVERYFQRYKNTLTEFQLNGSLPDRKAQTLS